MALLVGQLLFAAPRGANVQLDLIVLERADAPSSPAIGEPVCFEFALPDDAVWRSAMTRLLRGWADSLLVVRLDLLERGGRTLVQLAARESTLTLEAPVA